MTITLYLAGSFFLLVALPINYNAHNYFFAIYDAVLGIWYLIIPTLINKE